MKMMYQNIQGGEISFRKMFPSEIIYYLEIHNENNFVPFLDDGAVPKKFRICFSQIMPKMFCRK